MFGFAGVEGRLAVPAPLASPGNPGEPWGSPSLPGATDMPTIQDFTTIDIPIPLRDLVARYRLHPRQAYYEVLEEAMLYWIDNEAWSCRSCMRQAQG